VAMNPLGTEHRAVAALRRWAIPHLPVGPLGNLFHREIAVYGRVADTDAHRLHLADTAAADVLRGPAKHAAELRPLLTAGLEDDLVLAHLIDNLLALADGQRH